MPQTSTRTPADNFVAGTMRELNDNGAWSWFMDERSIVHSGKLLVGSIRSSAHSCREGMNDPRWGNCELAVHDLASGKTSIVVLHEHFERDDHGDTWQYGGIFLRGYQGYAPYFKYASNDIDTFNQIISHGGGQRGAYMSPAWYRKHFKLASSFADQKLFIEFEGIKHAGQIYVNGKQLGLYENGVTAYGVDITDAVHFGDADNVLAVRVDNGKYLEQSSGVGFEWESNDFNPNYGGINRVAIRSTLTPGTITLTASREGLDAATLDVVSAPGG
jgi:hypothetical protein